MNLSRGNKSRIVASISTKLAPTRRARILAYPRPVSLLISSTNKSRLARGTRQRERVSCRPFTWKEEDTKRDAEKKTKREKKKKKKKKTEKTKKKKKQRTNFVSRWTNTRDENRESRLASWKAKPAQTGWEKLAGFSSPRLSFSLLSRVLSSIPFPSLWAPGRCSSSHFYFVCAVCAAPS